MTPPYGTRLILVADNLLDLIGTRDSDGRALSYQYGAPDINGWYSPTVNAEDDGKVIVDRAELDGLRRLRGAIETEWYNGNVDQGAFDRLDAIAPREPKP